MESATLTLSQLVPVISAIGFGVQQFLQVLVDPFTSVLITMVKDKRGVVQPDGTKMLPGGISDVDAKKAVLGLTSFVLGILIVASIPSIRILKSLEVFTGQSLEVIKGWDFFITALTISAGTEGANSVIKLLQYVKDAVKTRTPPSVAQSSPVPQSPATIVSEANTNSPEFLVQLMDSADRSTDTLTRAKEEDYAA